MKMFDTKRIRDPLRSIFTLKLLSHIQCILYTQDGKDANNDLSLYFAPFHSFLCLGSFVDLTSDHRQIYLLARVCQLSFFKNLFRPFILCKLSLSNELKRSNCYAFAPVLGIFYFLEMFFSVF